MSARELLLLSFFARAKKKEAKKKPAGCTSGATARGVGLKQKKLAALKQFLLFHALLPLSASRPSDDAGAYPLG